MKCLTRSALLALAALGATLPRYAAAALIPAAVTTTGDSVTTTVLSDQSTVVKFLADGTFTVPDGATARLLLVGGGGSGGRDCSGGGGAGGFVEASDVELSPGTYTVTVGAGGAEKTSNGQGNDGSPTVLSFGGSDLYTALGGGGGGGWSSTAGRAGGSGGGGCNNGSGGAGTEGQGYAGGNAGNRSRAGGGGAGGPGESNSDGDSVVGGAGGPGKASNITGEEIYYAGGGGGGGHNYKAAALANGGVGGGGSGVRNVSVADRKANVLADGRTEYEAEAGVNGLGGGGGGANNTTYEGRPGGSGVLIVRLDPVASGPEPVLYVAGAEDGANSAVVRVHLFAVGDNASSATVSYKFATSVANLETAEPLVAATDVSARTTVPISLTGLAGGTTVYVRVFAENDLRVAATPVDVTVHPLVSFAPASFDLFTTFTVTGYAGTDPLTNFPVLVRLSDNSPAGFAYADCAADGSDLRFTDAAGNLIPHEIDTWNPAGESLLWVRVPVVTVGAAFKMYYSASVPGVPSSEDVWARYAVVIHGGDSLANAVAGGVAVSAGSTAVSATAGSGIVGGGVNKSTANAKGVNVANPAKAGALANNSEFSLSGWFKRTGSGTAILAGSRTSWNSQAGFLWLQEASDRISVAANNAHQLTTNNKRILSTDSWTHLAFTVNDTVDLRSYFDGAPDQAKASPATLLNTSNAYWTFGSYCDTASGDSYSGDMDELRIFDGVASGDWIKAEHDTIASATFLSADIVAPVGASAEPLVGLVASSVEYTNATFSATVGSLGMDAGMTADATWADLLLVVGTEPTLSSPAFAVPLSRATTAPFQASAPLAGLSADTVYYAQLRATNSLGVAGESHIATFATLPPGPAFTAEIGSEHLVPAITLSFTRTGLAASVARITVLVSGSGDFDHPDVTKTLEVDLAEMPATIDGIDLVGLPASSTLSYRFIAKNSAGFVTVVDAQAASPIGAGDNVWSGLSEDIDDPNAYVFLGGLPTPDKTLYFTKPAGMSPVIDRDVTMPSLRFTNGKTDDADTTYLGGYHSCGYDLSGSGVLTFSAEKAIWQGTKGTNVVRNPILFNRSNSQTVYFNAGNGHLVLSGELMLPSGVSNTTMRATGTWSGGGVTHFAGPSPGFMGKLHIESNSTLSLDHPGAMTNVSRVFFGEGWGSYTYLKNNTGAPMTFPRCETMDNETGWSSTRICYVGAPFVFPVGTLVWGPRAWDGVISADLVVRDVRVTKNGSNGDAGLEKNGTGALIVTGTTSWSGHSCQHYIRLRGGCFWAQTAAGLPPGGDFFVPDGSGNQSTLGLSDDFSPMLDGSSTPRVFQSSSSGCWGFTGFGGDRVVCWNADPTLNLTNTTSGSVAVKLSSDGTTTNTVGKTYDNYYAYPAYFMFGNRSEFADGTILFLNPIRYELGQNWDATTRFESTNHVVAARLRGSLRLGNRDKTWNFSGRNFGGYLALEADNADFTGKVNVYEKGNLLVNSNLVARSVTVQSGAGLGGIGTLSTEEGTTVKSGGTLFGGEWNKGGVLTLEGKVTLEGGSALRAEVGASNDRIGFVKLAAGSTLKLAAPVYVDVDTDPRVSPVRGMARKILDWSEASFDSGSAPTREDFVARPESNSDIETIYVFTRADGLYVNYITVRYPPSTIMILR